MSLGRVMKRIGIFLLTFLTIIPMQVNVDGLPVGVALVVIAGLSVRYLGRHMSGTLYLKREHRLFGILLLLLIYFLFVAIIGQMRDISMIIMCIYGGLIYAAALELVNLYRKMFGDRFDEIALKYIFFAGFIHSLLQIGVLIFPPVADAIYTVVVLSDNSATHISQGYRSPGLFSSGAAILGTFNAQILVIGLVAFLRVSSIASWHRIVLVALATVLQIGAIAISGRTGFVALVICLLTIFSWQFFENRKFRFFRNMIHLCGFSVLLVTLAMLWFDTEAIEQNLRWSFEFFYSLMEGQGLKTESTSVLLDQMFFLPTGWFDLLFGTANFGRSSEFFYIDSDAGYILLIFGSGLVGTLLAMSVYAYMMAEAMSFGPSSVSMLLLSFAITIFFINVKDFYFLQNSGVTQIVMLCFALLMMEKRLLSEGSQAGARTTVRRTALPGRLTMEST